MKKHLITIFFMCTISAAMWGQPNSVSLPDLLTPSPKASMMKRFGNYPTNLYTGLVDITIPIHTIEVKDITIPIEFKYHASGLKYDDLPMELGYGWTLIAGGTVSYSARATGFNPPYGTNKGKYIKEVSQITKNDKTGANSNSDQLQLEYVINGTKSPFTTVDNYRDSEYDSYSFSFAGHNGEYYSLYGGEGFSVPASTLQFTWGSRPTAKDENGNTYYFDINDQDGVQRNYTCYLTKIISANLSDTINFVYRQVTTLSPEVVKRPVINNTFIIKEISRISGGTSTSFDYGGIPGVTYKSFNTPFLTEINYNGGKVKFIYSASSTRSLTQIQITNHYGSIIRIINLGKTDNKYLNSVSFCGANGSSVYSYRFEYNGTKPETAAPIDYWGYYNGTSTSATLYVPNFTVPVGGYTNGYTIPGMNRNPNETQMQKGILNKIVYPTKGYTTFIYEGHKANNQLYGGLRIKEIKNYDDNGTLLESKFYKYGSSEDGNGRATKQVSHTDFLSPFLVVESLNVGTGHQPTAGEKTLYKTYDAFSKYSYLTQGSTVVYPYVTEYIGSSTGAFGKTVYNYTDFQDYYYDRTIRGYATELPKWSYAWKCGKLLRKTVFDSNGQTVYYLHNTYQEINVEDYLNLRVNTFAQISNASLEKDFSNYPSISTAIEGSLHDYYNYYITCGEYVVKESREMVDGVIKTIQYGYNSRGQLTEETYIDPENNRFTTNYRYPNEFPSTAPYNTMIQKNIVGPVIEREEFKNGTQLYKISNNYKAYNNNLIALWNVNEFNTKRISYDVYDKYGNPRGITKDDIQSVSYIYSYRGRYPIAEIKNTTYGHLVSSFFQSYLDVLTDAVEPSAEHMARMESLRNNGTYARCQVTTFYYNNYGLSKVIAPNGTITTYEYDNIGRLSRIKDHNGKIVEEYQYNYK